MENIITKKLIEKIQWWTYDEIRWKVEQEYSVWKAFADKKRPILYQYMKEYHIQGDKMQAWEVVKSKSLYTNRNLFASALYKNRPVINIQWRKQWDSEYADTWNNLLKFDYEELDEDIIMYQKITNMVDYWIYLAVDEWWDKTTESPKKRLMHPLCWIPDPDFDLVHWFNFHWFELTLTEWEINNLYNNKEYMLTDKELEEIKKATGNWKGWYIWALNSWADWTWLGFPFSVQPSNLRVYSVYRHFTKFNGRWYLTEWANDRTLLLRLEEVKAVRAEEKKDPRNIPCPVVHSWFIPKEWDPYWVCVWDIGRDNQYTEEQVMNLLFYKTHEEVFSWIIQYDPMYVKWSEISKKVIGKKKYLPVSAPINSEPIKPINTQTSSSTDWYNLKNLIDQKSTKEIWFDEQSIWVYSKTITATQSQLLQWNQNVRLSTIFKIFLWWERKYWDILWYRSYQANFKMKSEKNFELNSWIGSVTYTIKWKDLNTKADLHLRLISILDKAEKDEADRAAMMAAYQPLRQWASPFWQILLDKAFARVVWMDKELVNSIYEMPPEYEKAMLDLELLNNNEDVWEIMDMQENHSIYIQVYQQAIPSKYKDKAIAARKRALVLSWQQRMMQQNAMMQQWWQDASTNQLVSNYISQSNQNKSPNVLWPQTDTTNAEVTWNP